MNESVIMQPMDRAARGQTPAADCFERAFKTMFGARSFPGAAAPSALMVAALVALSSPPARAQLEPQHIEEAPPEPPPPPVLTAPPELLAAPDPIYPEAAKAEGRHGTVVMRITIDAQGAVTDVVVLQGAGADLDAAAVAAARTFKFKPAEWNGVPGPVAIDYSTGFAMETVIEEVPIEEPPVAVPISEASINFEGLVREATSKAPLEGVEVSVEMPGAKPDEISAWTTTTDADGRFTMRGVPTGNQRVVFSLTAFETHFIDEDFSARERTEVIVYLEPRNTNVFETVVRQRRAKKEVSKIALTREEVRRIPGTFGDPLRVIESLPGLARAPFIGGALIVRGANPQDSGIYFDGVPIPILYHFGGLTSVVNAEFIEEINFMPGGFGAAYGRATAGVVDVESRRLNLERFRGAAEVDLFDTGFFLGGPIKIFTLPKITIAAAARRSYIDALLPTVLDAVVGPDGQGIAAAPIYSDYQVKAEVEPLEGHVFSVLGFGSIDDLKVIASGVGDASFDLGVYSAFHRIVGRYEAKLAPGVTNRLQPFAGITSQNLGANANLGEDENEESDAPTSFSFGIANAAQTWGVRDEVTLKPWSRATLRAGLDYLGQKGKTSLSLPIPTTVELGGYPGAQRPVGEVLQSSNTSFTNESLVNAGAVYVEGELGPFMGVTLVPGLRLENTQVQTLPQTRNGIVVQDGATAVLWNVDPRFTARIQLFPGSVVKGAVGVYRQPPGAAELHPSVGNPLLDQPRAVHLIAGVEQILTDDLNIDVQVYQIRRDLLVQQTERIAFEGEATERDLRYDNRGLGRTYGMELLLRHELSRYFFGWIAYTLSRTEVDVDEKNADFVLTQFDQTHILTVVGQASLPWGFTFGARFRLVSGSPTDANAGAVHDLDTDQFEARTLPFGSKRLPMFHQLDLRLDRKWVFDAFSATAYIDLINAYNAPNAEAYQNDYRFREKSPIPSLPIAPILGISGEF